MTQQRVRADARLMFRVRGGRVGAFRYVYQRHYAAAFGYAHVCTGRRSVAHDLVDRAFEALLGRTLSGWPASVGPHQGCVRLQVLNEVRTTAIAMLSEQNGSTVIVTPFTSWVARGAMWSVTDDERILTCFRRLPLAQQLALWHTVIEGEDCVSAAVITGVAPDHVHLAREHALRALTVVIAGLPDEDHAVESRQQPEACDVTAAEPIIRDQLPRLLLGWWPPSSLYLKSKRTAQLPLRDPAFLRRELRRNRPAWRIV